MFRKGGVFRVLGKIGRSTESVDCKNFKLFSVVRSVRRFYDKFGLGDKEFFRR